MTTDQKPMAWAKPFEGESPQGETSTDIRLVAGVDRPAGDGWIPLGPLATQARAAAEVPATAWIDVSVQMPPPGRPVLVTYTTHHTPSRQRVNRAMWIPAKFEEADGESDNFEYDEATDTNWTPAGWYECIDHWDEYSAVAMASVTVTQWAELPLPAAPAASKGDAA